MVAKVYKVLYDTDPPCRARVHMFTIIQFLRTRANVHTIFQRAKNVNCIHRNNGVENSYQPIPRLVYNIEALLPQDLCFYIAYKPRELVNNYYIIILRILHKEYTRILT